MSNRLASVVESDDVDHSTAAHGEDLPPLDLAVALRLPIAIHSKADEDLSVA